MSAPHIIFTSFAIFCEKISELVEIRRSYDKNNFAYSIFETRCMYRLIAIYSHSQRFYQHTHKIGLCRPIN